MLNCVCGPGSDANAVLIRAAEPVRDSLPWLHRTAQDRKPVQGVGVKPAQNGADLCDPEGPLIVLPRVGRPRIARGPRIGVDYAGAMGSRAASLLRPEQRPSLEARARRAEHTCRARIKLENRGRSW